MDKINTALSAGIKSGICRNSEKNWKLISAFFKRTIHFWMRRSTRTNNINTVFSQYAQYLIRTYLERKYLQFASSSENIALPMNTFSPCKVKVGTLPTACMSEYEHSREQKRLCVG